MRLVSAEEMRAIERIAIEEMGIPAATLMERAGRAVAEAATSLAGQDGRIAVVCGAGNNGGDGFVAARILHMAGRGVLVVALGPPGKGSPESIAAWRSAEDAGVPVSGLQALLDFPVRPGDLVVDAIFGTGLERPPEGNFAAGIEAIRALREQGARVLAVDLPSGLSTDSGRALGPTVQADATVTFAFSKIGLALQPGADLAGDLTVVDIGIPPAAADRVHSTAELLDEAAVRALVPRRDREAHKGDAGRLLVVAGSAGKTGAANLALTGALRGGAGLVTLAARAEVLGPALVGRPEAMSTPLPGTGTIAPERHPGAAGRGLDARTRWCSGPGIPRGPETAPAIRGLLDRYPLPTVLDADASTRSPTTRDSSPSSATTRPSCSPRTRARWRASSAAPSRTSRPTVSAIARRKAQEWGAVVVLKGARTVVADPDGPAAIIPTGNPGMATGGTGDVLAGLLGALLAGGLRPREAARVGAWVHGRAGDLAAQPVRRARDGGRRPGRGHRRGVGGMGQVNPPRRGARGAALTRSASETRRARGADSGGGSPPGDVVALSGSWGPGRPSSARGICRGAGVPDAEVSSPTFAIVATYRGRLLVNHADLYRIGDEDELHATGFDDLVGGRGHGGGVGRPGSRRAAPRAAGDPARARRRRPSVRRLAIAGLRGAARRAGAGALAPRVSRPASLSPSGARTQAQGCRRRPRSLPRARPPSPRDRWLAGHREEVAVARPTSTWSGLPWRQAAEQPSVGDQEVERGGRRPPRSAMAATSATVSASAVADVGEGGPVRAGRRRSSRGQEELEAALAVGLAAQARPRRRVDLGGERLAHAARSS